MDVRALLAFTVLSLLSPVLAAGQGAGMGVSVQGAIGSHLGDGGNAQSLSVGLSLGQHIEVVLNAERSYRPTSVEYFEGGYSASRGANTKFISGEFRYAPFTYRAVSPYLIFGHGIGVSRPNVNEFFPERVTHRVTLQFPGFGVRVGMTGHLSAFSDLRIMLQHRRGEPDAGIFGPIRGGIAWRF